MTAASRSLRRYLRARFASALLPPSYTTRRDTTCVFKRPSGTGCFDATFTAAEIASERTFEKAPLDSLFARR